jgi:hypothetical protein
MPPWLSILIAVIVPLLTLWANAWVNMKIKFAPDEGTAKQELKGLVSRIFEWIMNVLLFAVLIHEVFFVSEPLTRFAVFGIALQVGVLTLILVFYVFNRLARLLERSIRTIESQVRHRGNP